jgi:hypothetical protein
LPGWWLGAEDNRAEQPYISPERWTKELVAAGFQAPEAIVLDYVAPYQCSAGIIASRESRVTKPSRVTLFCHAPDAPYVTEMRLSLEMLNIGTDVCEFGQSLPAQDVISLLDLQEPTIHGMSEHTFSTLIANLKSLKANMLWITPASQVNCEDPRAAMILGLARTARNEMSIRLFTVEVDSATLHQLPRRQSPRSCLGLTLQRSISSTRILTTNSQSLTARSLFLDCTGKLCPMHLSSTKKMLGFPPENK